MLYKDVSELTDFSYGYVNLVSELRGYLLTLTTSVALRVRIRKLRLAETFSVLQDETFTGRLTGIFMPSPAVCVIMSPLHCRVKRSAMQSLPDQLRCFGGTHIEASSRLREWQENCRIRASVMASYNRHRRKTPVSTACGDVAVGSCREPPKRICNRGRASRQLRFGSPDDREGTGAAVR